MSNLSSIPFQCKLLIDLPKSDFGDFLRETFDFWNKCEPVRKAVESDLRAAALWAKHERERKKQGLLTETLPLASLDLDFAEPAVCALELSTGRPRMPSKLVFAFCMIRGWMGSICSGHVRDYMLESQSLSQMLEQLGIDRLPGATTILENINAVRPETLELIHRLHLRQMATEELDDFKKAYIDSTSVKASSDWPTDSRMLYKLLERALRLGETLPKFGLEPLRCVCSERWLEQIRTLDFQIALIGSKANAKTKRRKLYREIYHTVCKLLKKLMRCLAQRLRSFEKAAPQLTPWRREKAEELLKAICADTKAAAKVLEYSMQRIEENIGAPTHKKVLSIADESARIIVKGEREPVLGYKPQLARSGSGFVSALIIEEGNGSDAHALEPMVRACIGNTAQRLQQVSVDDGYAWKKGLEAVRELGVEDVSISGSKGKKLLGDELWNEPVYCQLRAGRSSAESLMYVLKHHFDFARMSRRGIKAVHSEMLEKVLAYNFSRGIWLRRQKKETPPKDKTPPKDETLPKAA